MEYQPHTHFIRKEPDLKQIQHTIDTTQTLHFAHHTTHTFETDTTDRLKQRNCCSGKENILKAENQVPKRE